MIDFKKLRRVSPMSRRMFIIKNIGENRNVEVEYLFGLLNLYNKKIGEDGSGRKLLLLELLKMYLISLTQLLMKL